MKWLLGIMCLVGLLLANAPDVHAQTCVNGQCSKQANTIYLGQSLDFSRVRQSAAGFSHSPGPPAVSHPQLVHTSTSCDSLTRNVQYVSDQPQPPQPCPVILYPVPDPCFTPGCQPVLYPPCHCHQFRPPYQANRKTIGIGLSLSWGGSRCYGGSCR